MLFVTPLVCLLPDLLLAAVRSVYYRTPVDIFTRRFRLEKRSLTVLILELTTLFCHFYKANIGRWRRPAMGLFVNIKSLTEAGTRARVMAEENHDTTTETGKVRTRLSVMIPCT